MAQCICRTLAHGHGDRCELEGIYPDGLCGDCHAKTPAQARDLLEDEERDPVHLESTS
jgi:hypothetical protein